MLRKTMTIIFTLMLSGCANPVTKFYKDLTQGFDPTTNTNFEKCNEPRISHLEGAKDDLLKVRENGWMALGYSAWNGKNADYEYELLSKARENKACLITIIKKYSSAESGSTPLILPNNQTSYSNFSGTAFGSGGTTSVYGSGTTTTYGTTVTNIPYTVHRYEYSVGFWVKQKSFRVGLEVSDLNDDAKKQINSNKGVIVELVVKNTTGFQSDIMRGDIITKIGSDDIIGLESYYKLLDKYQGSEVEFIINRNGNTISKKVSIIKNT